MNRYVKWSVLAALALGSAPLLAADLGEIQVQSALNKPLVAQIPLQPEQPGEADNLDISLAPEKAFENAGISRDDIGVALSFQVATTADGGKVIRVTSDDPVHEPFLDFVVQVSSPTGKSVREYTVLLDPETANTSVGKTAVTTTSTTSGGTRKPSSETATSTEQTTRTDSGSRSRTAGASDEYTVHKGDTLSKVARANRLNGISYQQMLVALKKANPDAFFEDNMNALKSGAILQVPTREQARQTSHKAAVAAVRKQTRAWRSESGATMVAGAGNSGESGSTGPNADESDRLTLVPPDDDNDTSGNGGTADSSGALARSKEKLASAEQTQSDLESRVKSLQKIKDKNKRLLSLKNDEVAELQDKLAQARSDAGLPAAAVSSQTLATSGSAGAPANSAHGASTGLAEVRGPTADATTAAAGTVAIAAAGGAGANGQDTGGSDHGDADNTTATQPDASADGADASASGAPWYTQLWAKIVLVIVLLGLILWVILRRGGKGKNKDASSRRSVAHHFGEPAPEESGATPDPESASDGELDDLLSRLQSNPEDPGLHLELASVYYARGDAASFRAAAETMDANIGADGREEWQQVAAMGRELDPENPLFAEDGSDQPGAVEPPASDADGSSMLAGLGAGVPDPASDREPSQASEAPADAPREASLTGSDALGFDFESGTTPEPQDETTTAPTPDAAGFDFTADDMTGANEGETHLGAFETDTGDNADDSVELGEAIDLDAFTTDATTDSEPEASESTGSDAGSSAAGGLEMPEPTPETAPESRSEPALDIPVQDADTTGPGSFDVDADAGTDDSSRVDGDDPVDTKLDLARAYMDMGDSESARAMLSEAMADGTQVQKDAAQQLLNGLG